MFNVEMGYNVEANLVNKANAKDNTKITAATRVALNCKLGVE